MTINKSQFVAELAGNMHLRVADAERIVNAIFASIYQKLANGDKVNFTGFGQFSVSHRASRTGVNPRNPSEKINIPALNTPKFKAGDGFKQAIRLH